MSRHWHGHDVDLDGVQCKGSGVSLSQEELLLRFHFGYQHLLLGWLHYQGAGITVLEPMGLR